MDQLRFMRLCTNVSGRSESHSIIKYNSSNKPSIHTTWPITHHFVGVYVPRYQYPTSTFFGDCVWHRMNPCTALPLRRMSRYSHQLHTWTSFTLLETMFFPHIRRNRNSIQVITTATPFSLRLATQSLCTGLCYVLN